MNTDSIEAEKVRRLRAARATGHVPADLIPWLVDLATRGTKPEQGLQSPAERLAVGLSDEVDRWMRRRGVTHRTISASRRTLARCLKGANVTIDSVADVADALGCDAVITFKAREPRVAPPVAHLAPPGGTRRASAAPSSEEERPT